MRILQKPTSKLRLKDDSENKNPDQNLKKSFFRTFRNPIKIAVDKGDTNSFKSILQKSIHGNPHTRDAFMNITMRSRENTAGMFVDSLADFSHLL